MYKTLALALHPSPKVPMSFKKERRCVFERKRRECISKKRGKERGVCKREKGIYVYV